MTERKSSSFKHQMVLNHFQVVKSKVIFNTVYVVSFKLFLSNIFQSQK